MHTKGYENMFIGPLGLKKYFQKIRPHKANHIVYFNFQNSLMNLYMLMLGDMTSLSVGSPFQNLMCICVNK